MIEELDKKFDTLKLNTRECIERRNIPLKNVVDVLTSLSLDEDDHHKLFIASQVRAFAVAANFTEIFSRMNSHWSYLDPGLLRHLVKKLHLMEVKAQMELYISDLKQFRRKIPLYLFCKAQRRKRMMFPPDFHRMVTEFECNPGSY